MGPNEQMKLFISRQKQSMKEPKLKAIAVGTPRPAYNPPRHRQSPSPSPAIRRSPSVGIRTSVEDPRHYHQAPATSYRSTSWELTPGIRLRSPATTVSQNGSSQEQSEEEKRLAVINMYKQMYLEDYGVSKVADLPDNAKINLRKALLHYRSPKQSVVVEEEL
ncbi:hypothetical protein M011DRAFT_170475 [Sporormia fimetaria CBS 119925]|uniref:Uncharacterized protein n=1 Tax=Sporormia fimetaria CBS 119925 TaxID=1340428 RepID=A0A6A6V198_9PLEO|nr:hypothetical protein M011DRAFT_170475 [Sporormia fimetaria CBS 119925]